MEPVKTSTLSVIELLVEDGPRQTGKVINGWSPFIPYFGSYYDQNVVNLQITRK